MAQADGTGSKVAERDEEAKQVRGRALVHGRSQKPVRLTLTTRQEKHRVLVKAPRSMKLGFIASRSGNGGKHEEDTNQPRQGAGRVAAGIVWGRVQARAVDCGIILQQNNNPPAQK